MDHVTHCNKNRSSVYHPKAFIRCAGSSIRWQGVDGPKQMARIAGESLLGRMVRQLHDLGYFDITIVASDPRIAHPDCTWFRPKLCRWTVETLLSTCHLWCAANLVLLGDVYFTEQAMQQIARCNRPLAVFGRPGPSRFTGSKWAEIFAVRIGKDCKAVIRQALTRAVRDATRGGRGKLWELYRVLTHQDLRHKRLTIFNHVFEVIDDLTDDIDTISEWRQLESIVLANAA